MEAIVDKRKARGGNLEQQQAELEQIRAQLEQLRAEVHKLAYKENKLHDKIIKRQKYANDPEYRQHAIAQVIASQRRKKEKQLETTDAVGAEL
jgi:predicted nuclease with TOPRIM domain